MEEDAVARILLFPMSKCYLLGHFLPVRDGPLIPLSSATFWNAAMLRVKEFTFNFPMSFKDFLLLKSNYIYHCL